MAFVIVNAAIPYTSRINNYSLAVAERLVRLEIYTSYNNRSLISISALGIRMCLTNPLDSHML